MIAQHRRARGFTLIEVLVMVVLLGLLVRAVPDLRQRFQGEELQQAVKNASQFIRYAQYRAVAQGEPIQLVVDAKNRTYQIHRQVQGAGREILLKAIEGEWGKIQRVKSSLKIEQIQEIIFFADGATSGGRLLIENPTQKAFLDVQAGLGLVHVEYKKK